MQAPWLSPEPYRDQAAGLIHMPGPRQRSVRVIAVTGGKGGVGKTTVSINLALALRLAGREVMLLDADLGLANVDVLLGLQPAFNLAHVLEGKCRLEDTIIEGPMGLQIVPAPSGRRRMTELTRSELAGVIAAFSELQRPLDTLIIDTAAGISESVVTFCQAAQEVVVVVCNDPASLTDAYALIKVLSRDYGVTRVQIVPNIVRHASEGRELFDNLSRVTERFLDVTLNYLGSVPHDELLRKSVQRQRAVIEAYPNSPSANAMRSIARSTDKWEPPTGARGHLEFFVERLVGREPLTSIAA
jgi:flagellar biosynthesis protein FlhG